MRLPRVRFTIRHMMVAVAVAAVVLAGGEYLLDIAAGMLVLAFFGVTGWLASVLLNWAWLRR